MSEYGYSLTLKVHDNGMRSYSCESTCSHQDGLQERLAYEIANMFRIMNSPPRVWDIALHMDQEIASGLALLEKYWDTQNHFEDAIEVSVDIEKLIPTASEEEKAKVERIIKQYGFKVKESK